MASLDYRPTIVGSVAVKICGLQQPEHAIVAAQAGADMAGIVFAASRRQVSMDAAVAIRDALDGLQRRPQLVGVFVNESTERMLQVAAQVGLDVLQLSGDETPEQVAECAGHYPVLKALRFPADMDYGEAVQAVEPYVMPNVRILLDTYSTSEYGGTGERGNWSLARELSSHFPVILAGGLTPENVREAIESVGPAGVDVSSGVEQERVKSSDLIKQFIEAARSAGLARAAREGK